MTSVQLDSRKAEIVVGFVFVAVAAIVIRECLQLGAGWGTSGPQAGFFPLLAALIMMVGAVAVIVQAVKASGKPLFDSSEHAISVLKVGGPLALAVVSLQFLGFYLMTALYMAFFSAWYGRHRWPVVLAASLILPITMFLGFERGFRISLPKSAWYGTFLGF